MKVKQADKHLRNGKGAESSRKTKGKMLQWKETEYCSIEQID